MDDRAVALMSNVVVAVQSRTEEAVTPFVPLAELRVVFVDLSRSHFSVRKFI